MGGVFDRVGVDVIKFPKSKRGKQYAVVFMDYLTKWPEVFATTDQSSLTIAKLLVEHIVPRHGVPRELLSDRGGSFLSHLIMELYQLLGVKKVNTTAYHPQTDGLVERFNRTLTAMLSKSVQDNPNQWDCKLPYTLFAYRSSPQESTGFSPFYLLYGRDPLLPTDEVLMPVADRAPVVISEYAEEVVGNLQEAWTIAHRNIEKAQARQKTYHDRKATEPSYQVGDQVMLYMPAEKSGKNRKLARPYKGPFKIVDVYDTGTQVQDALHPRAKKIRVAWNRIFPFVDSPVSSTVDPTVSDPSPCGEEESSADPTSWKRRLRSRKAPRVLTLRPTDEDVVAQARGDEANLISHCGAAETLPGGGSTWHNSPSWTCCPETKCLATRISTDQGD